MNTRKGILLGVAMFLGMASMMRAEDEVYFADLTLKAVVEETLGVDDPTRTDMLEMVGLHASYQGITDLTGLEHAANLQYLVLEGNNISDISPMGGLRSLVYVILGFNQISDISAVRDLVNLWYLDVSHNNVGDISPMKGLTNLEQLVLHTNEVSDLSALAGLTNLVLLQLNENQISDIGPLSNLTKLWFLGLNNNNRVEDIGPLANLRSLLELYLDGNLIEDVSPLSGLTQIGGISLRGNQISDIAPLSGLNPGALLLAWNPIQDISPLSAMVNLRGLYLNGTLVADLSVLRNLANLETLDLDDNDISDIEPLSGLRNLVRLRLTCNPLLNRDAYCVYMPMILRNNPDIVLVADPSPYECAKQVTIDIKPDSYPNSINLGSKGLIPVAILSDTNFDATAIDPSSVLLCGAPVALRGKAGKYVADEVDVDNDGLVDLVLQVETKNFDPNLLQDGYAILTGTTFVGEYIEGKDEVTIVPPEKKK
ncbi:MAG: leucine-rich repeat domain-containing protein [Planctomycetes bacterium]|nr:leucine-rich repeat domain-containing protein [Planctomycetota bacterium]